MDKIKIETQLGDNKDERRTFVIDVGSMTPDQAEACLQEIKNELEAKKVEKTDD